MHHNLSKRFFAACIVSMVTTGSSAAPGDEAAQPKLVVGIMVDDLQKEYIDLLSRHFTKGGINRLINSGVVLTNVDYGTWLDPTAATAMIYTGATPAINGIPAQEVFDREVLHTVPIFNDNDFIGNYTDQTLSPMAMLTTTITDEVRIAGDGLTSAYAIAPDASQALVMAGHAANCGSWINDANLRWSTTTFYKDVPQVFNSRNREKPLDLRLDSMLWRPALDPNKYSQIPAHLTKSAFNYVFNKKGPESVIAYKNSPLVNREVTEFAIEHINSLDLGSHDGPDMISLAYTLEPFSFSKYADNRYELIDAYYRFDRDLQNLFETIDKKVGLHNTLVFLASTPAAPRSRRDDPKWRIPYGEFSTRKAVSLLNLYFISLYGNGSWVQGYHNNEFFLNHEFIKNSDKDLSTLRQQAAAFLIQMSGVGSAYSLDDILNNRAGTYSDALKRNININHAGDVHINVLPGWELLDDFNFPKAKPNQVARETTPSATVVIMAPGCAPKVIESRVDARSIAPTICRQLRIRSPNGSTEPAVALE